MRQQQRRRESVSGVSAGTGHPVEARRERTRGARRAKGETILARSVRRGHSWPRKKDGGGGSSGRRGWKMKENEVRWRRDGQPRGGNKKRQKSTACARGVQTPVTKESGQMQPIAYRVLSSTTCVTKIALTCKIRRRGRTRRGTGAPIRCTRARRRRRLRRPALVGSVKGGFHWCRVRVRDGVRIQFHNGMGAAGGARRRY